MICAFKTCKREYDINDTPGGIYIGAPSNHRSSSVVMKYHICPTCNEALQVDELTTPWTAVNEV